MPKNNENTISPSSHLKSFNNTLAVLINLRPSTTTTHNITHLMFKHLFFHICPITSTTNTIRITDLDDLNISDFINEFIIECVPLLPPMNNTFTVNMES